MGMEAIPNTERNRDMTTAGTIAMKSVTDAVCAIASECHTPALLTLTGAGSAITARREAVPDHAMTPDAIGATLGAMAALIARHPGMFDADVAGYAVVLPGQRVAFAVDRTGVTHHIQLPGVPTEPLRPDGWDTVINGLTAMINTVR